MVVRAPIDPPPAGGARSERQLLRVLLALSDPALAEALAASLRAGGHSVETCRPGDDLPARVAAGGVALVVLGSGGKAPGCVLAGCAALQRQGRAWVLALGTRPGAREQLAVLDAGADSYLPAASPALAVAQARALLRRDPPHPATAGRRQLTPEWAMDEAAGCLVGAGGERPLAPLELRVLCYLAARPGQAVSRAELLAAVWGRAADDNADQVDQVVCKLRQKLEPDDGPPRYLRTVRGVGYRYLLQGDGTPSDEHAACRERPADGNIRICE